MASKMKASPLLPLVCLVLLTCVEVTFGDENDVIKVIVEEGSDAILPCSLSSKENIESKLFDWKKDGQKEVFLYDAGIHYNNGRAGQDEQFKGRVLHFQEGLKSGNASIIIRVTKVSDRGNYTCDFPRLQPRQIFHITLVVGAAPKPSVEILDQTKDGMLLQCEVQGAFPKPKLHWQDSDGNILPAKEPQVMEKGGRYDIILNITVKKSDYYTCVATQEEINHRTDAETYVYFSGAAPKPSVKTLRQTDDQALLQCEVQGASPKPKLHWQDSDGNILPAKEPQVMEKGGRYDIILNITATKTDNYRCVATQEEINHRTDAETYVYFSGPCIKQIVAAVLVTLLVVGVLLAVLVKTGYITLNSKKGSSNAKNDPLGDEPLDSL